MPACPKNRVVRLIGEPLRQLRKDCWQRDRGLCQVCSRGTYWTPRFAGDPEAYDMAHIRVRRLGGDVLSNVKTTCHRCHMREHAGRKQ